jgi:hypothetical protein
MTTLAKHRRVLAEHKRKVKTAHEAYRRAVSTRNEAVRAAKLDGLPAAEAYELAGVTQSTFSRQQGDAGTASPAEQSAGSKRTTRG